MNLVFIPLEEAHRTQVIDIFNYYVENSFAAYPDTTLPYGFFDVLLENAKKYPAYVLCREGSDEIAGYCLLRPYIPFRTFSKTAEISYFFRQDFIGQGIGTQALNQLEADAKKLGITNILASVVSRNDTSLRFHHKNGFSEVGRLKSIGKKFGEYVDVVLFQKVIA